MVVLTASSVLSRARVSDLRSVVKLNVWGCSLSDVSIIEQCTNLQVFSASCNEITSLEAFTSCRNLQELYIRENHIEDIHQVQFLAQLPSLRILWLAGNPCCQRFGGNDELYRLWVLKHLPRLERLDNLEIQPAERSRAREISGDLPSIGRAVTPQSEHVPQPIPVVDSTTMQRPTMSPLRNVAKTPTGSAPSVVMSPVSGQLDTSSSRSGASVTVRPDTRLTLSSGSTTSRRPARNHAHYEPEGDSLAVDNEALHTDSRVATPLAELPNPGTLASTKSKLRNVNILSAALTLVKELDVESLQILQMEIHQRLQNAT
ncbi:hypothetical protein RvY_16125 [Ramazzottius varieornatus]|uniref:U2A'/phosphoprotein 32 family A C-terminal domain-containing protein n=1 Tax=Ramazzottius varieornatus TaxID=947166 RepID=A0A1D1VXC7_RAMVA|nr:hypothetical protein RvY_16125 [Ramazzottius varieornatus]